MGTGPPLPAALLAPVPFHIVTAGFIFSSSLSVTIKLYFVALFASTTSIALGMATPFSSKGNAIPHSHPSGLVRRFNSDTLADDKTWHEAKRKGAKLVELMLATDEKAGRRIEQLVNENPPSAASEWQGNLRQELKTWGWSEVPANQIYADMDSSQVESAVQALGIDGKSKTNGGRNIPYEVVHWDPSNPTHKKDQTYKVDGKDYRTTAARHVFCMNPLDGVIFGQFLQGPQSAAAKNWRKQPTIDELPKLRRLSDIFWGYWVRENPDIANIRYFWMQDIANDDTEEILARALQEANKEIRAWPGVTFSSNTDAGNAILGSANGAVLGWFLIQHKAHLGDKWIHKATVFIKDSESKWAGAHIIFHVGPAPDSRLGDRNIGSAPP